jgi:glutathione S-transferase
MAQQPTACKQTQRLVRPDLDAGIAAQSQPWIDSLLAMLLYNNAVSGNCYKVRLLAAHLGIALELVELDVVDRSNRPDLIGHLNPALRVPTLVLDDGRPLAESNAIIDYLAEGTEYLPAHRYERAQILGWQFFEQYEIEPNLAVARFFKLFNVTPSEETLKSKHAGGDKALQALERGLTGKSFLVGERYSVADISLYGYTHVAAQGGFDLSPYPSILAWIDRVAAQPGHIKIDG